MGRVSSMAAVAALATACSVIPQGPMAAAHAAPPSVTAPKAAVAAGPAGQAVTVD